MPTYKYVGRDVLNRKRKGVIEARDLETAKEALLNQGIIAIERLEEESSSFKRQFSFFIFNRISNRDLLIFTRQLYAMIHAGVPLVKALKTISEQVTNKRLKQIIKSIVVYIEEGGKFSNALFQYRDIFGDLYISMIRAAEEAGTFEGTLRRLSEYLERMEQLRGKIKSALFYPIFVLVVATIIIVGMMVFVIPMFQKLYADLGGTLPAITQMVIDSGVFLRKYIGWIILGIIIVNILIFQLRKKSRKFRYFTDLILLRLPIFGDLFLKSSIANFSRTFSSLLSSGITLIKALAVSADTANNEVLRKAIEKVRQQVEAGVSLSLAMSRVSIFPPMVVNMVAIGEHAGSLDDMVAKVADFYEEEVNRTVDALTSIIEPLMLVIIGAIIGVIILALYLPVFKLGELIKF